VLHCCCERVVQRLLGEVEVAEEADEGGEDAARVGAVDFLYRLASSFACVVAYQRQTSTIADRTP
jgi:hypothetical protein